MPRVKTKAESGLSLTEKVGEELRLSVKLDGDEDGVEKDENDDQPVKHLRLDDVTNSEP